jgi:hypothetical protein
MFDEVVKATGDENGDGEGGGYVWELGPLGGAARRNRGAIIITRTYDDI